MTIKKPMKIGQTLFGAYQEVLKHNALSVIALVIVDLIFPTPIVFAASVFYFGMLYISCQATLKGKLTPHLKDLGVMVGKRYLPALGLSVAVTALCLFAFFGPAAPLGILPNDWLGFLFYFLIFDILLFLALATLFVLVAVYLSYSLLFFWLDHTDLAKSLQKSYELVKGQWRRAAIYFLLSNVVPLIVFVAVPALLICLIGISSGAKADDVMHADITHFLLATLTIGVVFPLQILLNMSYFEKLKVRREPKKKRK